MITQLQKATAQAIVTVFETGTVRGDYSDVTLKENDAGHLTYGKLQTTLAGGGLFGLVHDYCAAPGARFGAKLAPYLPRLEARDLTLDFDLHLRNLLRAAADDAVMRDVQDAFFDREYWARAERAAARLELASPLALSVVFDGYIHGSFEKIARRVVKAIGMPSSAGEQVWLQEYVALRRAWLAGSTTLCATVYRMDAFNQLMTQDLWNLDLPLAMRGAEISTATLFALPPNVYDGPQPGTRVIEVCTPMQRGLDARLAQLALSERGAAMTADGIFGRVTRAHVMDFQRREGLPATGAVDAALFERLGVLAA